MVKYKSLFGGIMFRYYNILEELNNLSDEEAHRYIKLLFEGYTKRKKEKRLFDGDYDIPELIILTYYVCVKKPQFSNIYENFKNTYMSFDNFKNFKERYIYNENKLEQVHTKEERLGLRRIYDYIQSKEDLTDVNIYTLSDIHEILYSFTPYPEFGGKYRNDQRFLPPTGIELTSPFLIVREMNLLKDEVNDLVKLGNELGKNLSPTEIIDYIDKCVELKCKLIKIHPFGDGNGRTIRAFTNLLFKMANIPPVYIENRERVKYGEAMYSAINDEDFSKIKIFYYYKICDSIISLDTNLDSELILNEPKTRKLVKQ